MRLLRYGPAGSERPALLDRNSHARDLSAVISDIKPETLSPDGLRELARLDPLKLPLVGGDVRLGVPFTGTTKIVAIGLNYIDHAKEASLAVPDEPVVFMKPITSICGPFDDTLIPRDSTKLDWEVELGVVIGTPARYVSEADALAHVAGYCLVNDVSERHFQLERGGQWDKGKGCDTFAPLGPYLVTADDAGNPQGLDMWLDVNGKRMQTGNTANMIFGCAFLVSYVSRFMTLLPGDVIITGTPPGVGLGKTPPVFLKDGDVVTLGIDGLGAQRQRVRAEEYEARA